MIDNNSSRIKDLATNISKRKEQSLKKHVLFLGAGASISSGCPSWFQLCSEYFTERNIEIPNGDAISAFKAEMLQKSVSLYDLSASITNELKKHTPSLGYDHLAYLISQGYFDLIVTTNFDCLLEKALNKYMSVENFKVLVRGEVSDSKISSIIKSGIPKTIILKLHGDITSATFYIQDYETASLEKELEMTLSEALASDCLIVGSSLNDLDILRTLMSRATGMVYFINHQLLSNESKKSIKSASTVDPVEIIGDAGDFDTFFTILDLSIQKRFISSRQKMCIEFENKIISEQERGVGYIDYQTVLRFIDEFSYKIKNMKPDSIIFINEPVASGGLEIMRRLIPKFSNTHITSIIVEGDGFRTKNRKVRGNKEDINLSDEYGVVLVLDSITFTGNTLKIAIETLSDWFPNKMFIPGALIVDDELVVAVNKVDISGKPHPLHNLIHQHITNRHEVLLPWGLEQSTSETHLFFQSIDNQYTLTIMKEDWGIIEQMSHDLRSSVRAITIDSDRTLAFKRHLCRDSLFGAIDENVVLELCGYNLDKYIPMAAFSDLIEIKTIIVEKGEYVMIPRGVWYRFKSNKERVRMFEIAFGLIDYDNDYEIIQDSEKNSYDETKHPINI